MGVRLTVVFTGVHATVCLSQPSVVALDCFSSADHVEHCCCSKRHQTPLHCFDSTYTYENCCKHLSIDCPSARRYDLLSPAELAVAEKEERSCWNSDWQLLGEKPQQYPREICCDTTFRHGCFDDNPFLLAFQSFDRCCGPLWESIQASRCSAVMLDNVWEYLHSESTLSFSGLWIENSYHALYRIARMVNLEYHSTADLSQLDLECLFAFIATRILRFSKMNWMMQFSYLTKPDNESFTSQLDAKSFDLAYEMLLNLPLTTISLGSKRWVIFLLRRLTSHYRKVRNFLFPDMLPFQASFPWTDAGISQSVTVFREYMQGRIHRSSILHTNEFDPRSLGHQVNASLAHAFAQVNAMLAEAHSILVIGSTSEHLESALAVIATADSIFHTLGAETHAKRSHLFFTSWPFWQLLLQIAELCPASHSFDAFSLQSAHSFAPLEHFLSAHFEDPVLMMSCGDMQMESMYEVGWLIVREASRQDYFDCREAFLKAVRETTAEFVVVVSPFLRKWQAHDAVSIKDNVVFLKRHGFHVAGFPLVNSTGWWRWPVRRLRHEHYKLRYEAYPTGYEAAMDYCAGGDATSATRVYRAAFLIDLLEEMGAPLGHAELFVELDILTRQRNVRSWTCVHQPLHEDHYLEFARLTPALSQRHEVELAQFVQHSASAPDFGERGTWQLHCLQNRSNTTSDKIAYMAVQQGRSSPFCWRRYLEERFHALIKWWSAMDPAHNIVLAIQGTSLTALIRGGEVSVMPWDIDLEFVLASTVENPAYSNCGRSRDHEIVYECIRKLLSNALDIPFEGPHYIQLSKFLLSEFRVYDKLRFRGGGFDLILVSHVDMTDLLHVPFLGSDVWVSWPQWERQLFQTYGGNLSKKIGTSGNIDKSESCIEDGPTRHNACISNQCHADAKGVGCTLELPDFFAHARAI